MARASMLVCLASVLIASGMLPLRIRHRARWLARCASLGLSLNALWAGGVSAQPPVPAFSELAHTAWTVRDGAPGAVRGLTQGADGVLWIASERGLFQFDGVRFERFVPTS